MTWKFYNLQYNVSIYYVCKVKLILKYHAAIFITLYWLTFIKGNQTTSQHFLEHVCVHEIGSTFSMSRTGSSAQ